MKYASSSSPFVNNRIYLLKQSIKLINWLIINIYQVPGGLRILERKEIQHTIYEPLNWEMPMEKWKHKSLGDSILLLLISILPFLEKTIFN